MTEAVTHYLSSKDCNSVKDIFVIERKVQFQTYKKVSIIVQRSIQITIDNWEDHNKGWEDLNRGLSLFIKVALNTVRE